MDKEYLRYNVSYRTQLAGLERSLLGHWQTKQKQKERLLG